MDKLVALCLLGFISGCSAGTSAYHRTTSLDELKEIDSLVSTGLPLFDHGFFVNTARGPILVKAKDDNKPNQPRLNPGYYSTLPRLIPSGYEGIAISHFNLGSQFPVQTPSQYAIEAYNAQVAGQQQYQPQQQHQDQDLTGPIQYSQDNAPQVFEQQQSQSQSRQYLHRGLHSEHLNLQPEPQQHQQHFLNQAPPNFHNQPQQNFQPQPRQNFHSQLQQRFRSQPRHQTHLAQDTFQIDNFLRNEDDVPTSFQSQMMVHGPFGSRKYTRNPTVEQALEFDENLPENFRNPFYKNQEVATALAQESLPVEGEEVVGEWDTTKIQKKRIQDLLRAAGFI